MFRFGQSAQRLLRVQTSRLSRFNVRPTHLQRGPLAFSSHRDAWSSKSSKTQSFGREVNLRELRQSASFERQQTQSDSQTESSTSDSPEPEQIHDESHSQSQQSEGHNEEDSGSRNEGGDKRRDLKLEFSVGPKALHSWDALLDVVKMVMGYLLLTGIWKATFVMDTEEFDQSGRTHQGTAESLLYTFSKYAPYVLLVSGGTRLLLSIPKADVGFNWILVTFGLNLWLRMSSPVATDSNYLTLSESARGKTIGVGAANGGELADDSEYNRKRQRAMDREPRSRAPPRRRRRDEDYDGYDYAESHRTDEREEAGESLRRRPLRRRRHEEDDSGYAYRGESQSERSSSEAPRRRRSRLSTFEDKSTHQRDD